MKKVEFKNLLKIAATIFLLYLCIQYWAGFALILKTLLAASLPIFIGSAIAFPINILMSFYERHYFPKSTSKAIINSRRGVCVAFTLLTLIGIITLVIALIVPQITSCVKLIIAELPGFITLVTEKLSAFEFMPDDIVAYISSIDWQAKLTENFKTVSSGLGSVMDVVVTTVTSVVSGITTAVISIIFAVYVLLSKHQLGAQFKKIIKRYVPVKISDKLSYVVSVANESFHKFIVAQCTEAVILGVLCTIGMLILRLPYAPMIGAVMAVCALIPVIGGLISGGIGAFLILMESPSKALIFLIFIVVLQQVEGNLIYPRVVGSSIGIPSIWVLAAITIGGGMFGVLGMLVSVPIASTIYKLIRNDVYKTSATADGTPKKEIIG